MYMYTGALTTTNQLPIGTTQLTFTATDNCKNSVTHTYSLTVTNFAMTTTTVSTATDRYMTFFEVTRNVAWIVGCMAITMGLVAFIVRCGDFSRIKRLCDRLSKKCRRKRRPKIRYVTFLLKPWNQSNIFSSWFSPLDFRGEPTEISYIEPSRKLFQIILFLTSTCLLTL